MSERTRREFLKGAAALAGAGALMPGAPARRAWAAAEARRDPPVPSYLRRYEKLYRADPRAAAIRWFREARFGLFIHYGLYSLLGRHEWVQLREKIPLAEYARLAGTFTCKKFDAGFIADLAVQAEMKYVNLVTRHHDSFSLWDTKQSDFSTAKTAARCDLVGELAEACRRRGLGLFCYYSHGRDWRHPHAPTRERFGRTARPAYDTPEPTYKTGKDHDIRKYVAFMKAQITELLTHYGPIAGIWLDGIGTSRQQPDVWKLQELYGHIHGLQPQVLVSYKQGFLGTEDFFAPERSRPAAGDARRGGKVAQHPAKPLEICDTLQERGWGLVKTEKHKTADEVMKLLAYAAHGKANLLLNTGPLGDGSIHPADVKTLREVGRRIRADGWPAPETPPKRPARPKRAGKGKRAKAKRSAT